MVPFIPGDLLHIVLSKLPVKSLLRLRCVSKLWLNIIDSSCFIDMHFTQTVAKTCSNTIIIPYDLIDDDKSMPMYAFEFDNENNEAMKIDPPIVGYDISYVHTCNGLISLSTEDSFVIWNPATRKHRVVEKVIVDDEEGSSPYYGFGYDHKTDDYKVVMFGMKLKDKTDDYKMSFFGKKVKEEEKCSVHIYSLKTGSWRKARTTIHEIRGTAQVSVYANGAIHWIDTLIEPIFKVEHKMVAFDLTTEKWLPLTMPPKLSERPPITETWSLSNHHGSLYASCCDNTTKMVDLWVMNYCQGTKNNTWTKLFTIKGSLLSRVTPLWSLNKTSRHQVLIYDVHELELYDIDKRTRKSFDVYDILGGSGDSGIGQSVTFYETLVSV